MAPNLKSEQTGPLYEDDEKNIDTEKVDSKNIIPEKRKFQLVWRNIVLLGYLHLASLYGVYLCFTSAKWYTILFAFILYKVGGLGITAGVHRLWAHRAYKAKWPLRVFLAICNTLAFQDSIIHWARDHRVHHKYSETDADLHNANRGFFFSHVGWLLVRKHPEVRAKGKGIDISDLYADPIICFQHRYYVVLMLLTCFVMPTVVPWYYWGDTLSNSWHVCALLRFCITLHFTWLVNSAAHMWGYRPYDKNINPANNPFVSFFAMGEGWHNYHHTFPWDYNGAELGSYATNETTLFINACAKLGLAYDMKTVPQEVVKRRVLRTGDGSHHTWGWGDKDQTQEERDLAIIVAKKVEKQEESVEDKKCQ